MTKCTETKIGCFVIKNDVSPKAIIYFHNSVHKIQFNRNSAMSIYPSYIINITALDVGNYTLVCVAENSAEDKLVAYSQISLIVTESILQKPLFKHTITVDDLKRKNISITCVQSEKVSDLNNLTLMCQNETVSTKSSSITVYQEASDKLNCTCKHQYIDSCYRSLENSSNFNLQCTRPVFFVNAGNLLIVNTNVSIQCRGLESENSYSTITLTCLGYTRISNSTSNTWYGLVSKEDHGANCTCTIESLYCTEKE
uniref:Uncharacterized protein n=1 Tax=Biomphalaria glabrata TaxID=6526 RepID=A0A2C9L2X2_BIOGL